MLLELLCLPLLLVWCRQDLVSCSEWVVVLRPLPLELLELSLQIRFACLLKAVV